jgi:DNA-binding transcriptional LysR family regulator
MPDPAFDLRYLRFAVTAAGHGSFWQTAVALDVSQSMYAIASRAISSSRGLGEP